MKFLLLLLTSVMAADFFSSEQDDISVQQAWIKLAPPGATVNAAYVRLFNNASQEKIITAVSSSCCSHVMMHESRYDGDRVVMDHKEKLVIPAKSELVLTPGGLHLMLVDAEPRLSVNDTVNIVLGFSDGSEQVIVFSVKHTVNE